MKLGMHRFFMLDINDYPLFDDVFQKVIILISKVDYLFKNDYLTRLFQTMDSKKKQIKRAFNMRYLAYAYAFYSIDAEYSMTFLKHFMFSGMDNAALPSIREILDDLSATHMPDSEDYEMLLNSIVHKLDFGGYKFFLNMIYFCHELPNEASIDKFIGYYEKMAKKVYFEFQFDVLGFNEISSDEEME